MRNIFVLIGTLTCLLFISCQKEVSIENGSGGSGGSNTTGLLARTVMKAGTDSLTSYNTYDASKRLIAKKDISTFPGFRFEGETKLERSSSGVIQKMTFIYDSDTSVYTVLYDATRSRYTAKVTTFTISGVTVKDSTALTYDASGRVIKLEQFLNNGFSGGPVEIAKTEFTYDGSGNVNKATYFIYDPSGSYISYQETSYEYDSRVNPLSLGNEAFIFIDPTLGLENPAWASTRNVVKQTTKDLIDPSNNDVITTTYTYLTNNKPQSAIIASQALGFSQPMDYVYQ